jgi:hypothetical protein
VLPLLLNLNLLIFNVAWAVSYGHHSCFCSHLPISPATPPISFVLALPFLLLGDFIVTISPCPTPADAPGKRMNRGWASSSGVWLPPVGPAPGADRPEADRLGCLRTKRDGPSPSRWLQPFANKTGSVP